MYMATRISCLLILLLALTGCSGMRIVDSDVQAFATGQRVNVPANYRFERMPSQQGRGEPQERLEAIVQQALAGVGMVRKDAKAGYSVSIELRMARDPRAPWDDPPYWGGMFHRSVVVTTDGTVVHYPLASLQFDTPYYRREVHLLMRRLSDGVLVFESRANHDGRWSDDAAVLPAMFEAALQGFPNPPQGARRVNIEIPR
jgi:hypothetical protein